LSVAEPRLIAAGRASEVFDLGDGRVLRRFKSGGDPEREALVMRHARAHGYPVPQVLEVTADALVLARIEGQTMAEAASAGQTMAEAASAGRQSVEDHAAVLARLHEDLHEVDAPVGLQAVGHGDRLLHLDLHPANVILSPDGPVVIDWTNARRGEPAFDVALTWVIGATSQGLGRLGRTFISRFLAYFDRDELLRALPAAVDFRLADANVSDEERQAILRLRADEGV
jgi:aminoglycoside phosphotransferase (APT) family kinase protein